MSNWLTQQPPPSCRELTSLLPTQHSGSSNGIHNQSTRLSSSLPFVYQLLVSVPHTTLASLPQNMKSFQPLSSLLRRLYSGCGTMLSICIVDHDTCSGHSSAHSTEGERMEWLDDTDFLRAAEDWIRCFLQLLNPRIDLAKRSEDAPRRRRKTRLGLILHPVRRNGYVLET